MNHIIRVALIGVGGMGRKYAHMICDGRVKNMVLTAVVCRNEEACEWAKGLGEVQIFPNTEALFENAQCFDAVLIVTPHKTHPELAIQAFALGKHVLCDKPAGVAISEAKRMDEEAKKQGLIYGMIFHQRLYPKYRKIKQLLEERVLGDLSRALLVNSRYFRTAHYHNSSAWRSSWHGEGGGVLINQGQHLLDIWQWLLGMPISLYADIPFGKYNDFLVDDEATIHMKYPNKMSAVFTITTGEAIWQERLEIVGSKGKILLEDDTLHIWRYNQDSNEYICNAQTTSREELMVEEEIMTFDKEPAPYPQMLENFALAVIEQNPELLVAPGKEAIFPLMLTNAAYVSAWNEEKIQLPLEMELYDKMLKEQCKISFN